MDKILKIVNNILAEKHLPSIGVSDNIQIAGFSSPDMLILILRLEKLNYKVAGLGIQSLTTVESIYNQIQNNIQNRKIV